MKDLALSSRSSRVLLLLLVCVQLGSISVTASASPGDSVGTGRQTFEYSILRNGTRVGTHRLEIEHRDKVTRVRCQSQIDIGLFGFSFYHFQYKSDETWDEQGLRKLEVNLDDDGKTLVLQGNRIKQQFQWTVNDSKPLTQDMPVFPTNHWNPAVLTRQRVLNTLTGGINQVTIQPLQDEPSASAGTRTTGFRYSGDLHLVSWYDHNGHWVGMRFAGKDGSTIEYQCNECRNRRAM